MLVGTPTKTDITSAIPRMSLTADERSYFDYGELDSFSQLSFHHGRSFFEFEDEYGYMESRSVLTHVPDQVTLGFLPQATKDVSGTPILIKWFEDKLHCVVKGGTLTNNKVYGYDTATGPTNAWTDESAGLSTGAELSSATVTPFSIVVAQGGANRTATSAEIRYKRTNQGWTAYESGPRSPDSGVYEWKRIAGSIRAELVVGSPSEAEDVGETGASTGLDVTLSTEGPETLEAFCTNPSDPPDMSGATVGATWDYGSGLTPAGVHDAVGAAPMWETREQAGLGVWKDRYLETSDSIESVASRFSSILGMAFWDEGVSRGGRGFYWRQRGWGRGGRSPFAQQKMGRAASYGPVLTDREVTYNQPRPSLAVIKPCGIYNLHHIADSGWTKEDKWPSWLGEDLCGDNYQGITVFGGVVHFASGGLKVKRFTGTVLAEVGLDQGSAGPAKIGMESDRRGSISCLTSSPDLMFASIKGYTDNYSSIVAWNGSSWHDFYVHGAANAEINYVSYIDPMESSGLFSHPTLWFNIGTTIYFMVLPRNTLDPMTADNEDDWPIKYMTTGYLITSWFAGTSLFDVWKNWFKTGVYADNLSTDGDLGELTIDVAYQVDDEENAWITLDTLKYADQAEFNFPDSGTTVGEPFIGAKKIRLKFTLNRGGGANDELYSPRWRSYDLKFITKPDPRYGWTGIVKLSNRLIGLDAEGEEDQLDFMRRRLYGFREARRPVWFDDGISPPGRTNLVPNPSFEGEGATAGLAYGWEKLGTPTVALNAQYKTSGVFSQKVITGADFAAVRTGALANLSENDIAYGSVYLYVASGTVLVSLTTDSGTLASKSVSADSNATIRFRRVALSETAGGALNNLRLNLISTASATFYIDSADVSVNIPGGDDPTYVDGDYPRCYWTGDPHYSTSTRRGGYQAYITNVTEILRGIRTPAASASDDPVMETDVTLQLREVP